MKFAVIRKECTFRKGGAERYAANLCRQMIINGHQVFVLAKDFDPGVHPDITYIKVPVTGFTSAGKNISFHKNCRRILQRLDVDRVYALSRTYPADAFRVSDPLHAAWMKIRYGKLERFFQHINPRHRSLLRLERNIVNAENTKCIITNSRLARSQIIEHYPYPQDRIHVVYNGVDLDKFRPKNLHRPKPFSEELRILFVGQDFKRKGLDFLLEAGRRLKDTIPFRIMVVGKDKVGGFQRRCRDLGITDHVDFCGPTPDIEKFYQEADLFVFPSRYDPFANVCLEAMACGLPVITTSNNGASEIIKEGMNGFILPPDYQLAAKIAEKVNLFYEMKSDERHRMGISAKETAEQFTILENLNQTLKILENL